MTPPMLLTQPVRWPHHHLFKARRDMGDQSSPLRDRNVSRPHNISDL
jgi:hypothetical protein